MFIIIILQLSCSINQVIQKSIVVYGSRQCPHCVNFKAKLDSIGLEYTFHDIDISDQYALEMVARVKASGHTEGISIPVVVVNDQQLLFQYQFLYYLSNFVI